MLLVIRTLDICTYQYISRDAWVAIFVRSHHYHRTLWQNYNFKSTICMLLFYSYKINHLNLDSMLVYAEMLTYVVYNIHYTFQFMNWCLNSHTCTLLFQVCVFIYSNYQTITWKKSSEKRRIGMFYYKCFIYI